MEKSKKKILKKENKFIFGIFFILILLMLLQLLYLLIQQPQRRLPQLLLNYYNTNS